MIPPDEGATNWPWDTGPGSRLNATQVARARAMWDAGDTLGAIALEVGCTVDDLSPWLYRDTMRRLVP